PRINSSNVTNQVKVKNLHYTSIYTCLCFIINKQVQEKQLFSFMAILNHWKSGIHYCSKFFGNQPDLGGDYTVTTVQGAFPHWCLCNRFKLPHTCDCSAKSIFWGYFCA